MTTLFIFEKPSAMSEVAKAVNLQGRKGDGFIDAGEIVFTSAVGHLIKDQSPAEANPAWEKWNRADLPMLPDTIGKLPVDKTADRLATIGKLLQTATHVVIATDPGREGEVIGREILDYFSWKGKISRFWNNSMTTEELRRAYTELLPGEAKEHLYWSGLSRKDADWLVGLNGTRALSLNLPKLDKQAYKSGRVKNVLLAMIIEREDAINSFNKNGPQPFFELELKLTTAGGEPLSLFHTKSVDDRITDRSVIEAMAAKVRTAETAVLKAETKPAREAPPNPFSLMTLQQEGNKTLGLSAQDTLAVAQRLYDLKLTTYPRVDNDNLPEDMKPKVPGILAGIASCWPAGISFLKLTGPTYRKKVFDDSKVTDHFAIIPTGKSPDGVPLEPLDAKLFQMIVRRFLISLGPDAELEKTEISTVVAEVPFKVNGKVYQKNGWRDMAAL